MTKKLLCALLVAMLLFCGCGDFNGPGVSEYNNINELLDALLEDSEETEVTTFNQAPEVTVAEAETEPITTVAETRITDTSKYEAPETENTKVGSELSKTDTVYVTPTGKRYHINEKCGGKNSKPTTLEKALSQGLTPCQKCCK